MPRSRVADTASGTLQSIRRGSLDVLPSRHRVTFGNHPSFIGKLAGKTGRKVTAQFPWHSCFLTAFNKLQVTLELPGCRHGCQAVRSSKTYYRSTQNTLKWTVLSSV